MNRKIADSKKRWYTTFFTLKEDFKIVQKKKYVVQILYSKWYRYFCGKLIHIIKNWFHHYHHVHYIPFKAFDNILLSCLNKCVLINIKLIEITISV